MSEQLGSGMDSVLDVYLFEAHEMLEQLEEILIGCEKAGAFETDDINQIFRIMHTFKGSSAMMQFDSIEAVSHKLEDVFAVIRESGIAQALLPELFELLFQAEDFLGAEISKIENKQPLTLNIGHLTEKIIAFLKKIKGTGSPDVPAPQALSVGVADAWGIRVYFDDELAGNIRAFLLFRQIQDEYPDVTADPADVAGGQADAGAIAQSGVLYFFDSQKARDEAVPTIERFPYTARFELLAPAKPREIQTQASEAAAPEETEAEAQAQNRNQGARQTLINVSLNKLDGLMDLMGEFVIAQSMIESMLTTLQIEGNDAFDKAFRHLQKLTDELQENVMTLRMVPISSVFQKMNRIVRDMNKSLHKDVRLLIEGGETEVDKSVADAMGDPLLHVVRNSLDHGIEMPEERIRAGKPAQGTLMLSARNVSGEIIITVIDDGKGIDAAKVLKKARDKGLLTKPESDYTPREIYSFLLLPGFSTNEAVTEYSGRGVGMDVAQSNIRMLGGTVTMDSEVGKGTMTRFTIPPTLAIISGMKIAVGDSLFILPVNFIRQSFIISPNMIMKDIDQGEILKLRGEHYTLIRMSRHFGIPTQVEELTEGIAILVETQDARFCLFADAILGEQQVVIKPLPSYLERFSLMDSGLSGCAILGDGGISLIMDVNSLVQGLLNRGDVKTASSLRKGGVDI